MRFPESESKSSSIAAAEPCSAGRTLRLRSGQAVAAVPTWFVAMTRVLISTLREIFDESAYSRFLSRHGINSCHQAYAAFLREQEGIKARRPKCC
jgi:hypothetical protein